MIRPGFRHHVGSLEQGEVSSGREGVGGSYEVASLARFRTSRDPIMAGGCSLSVPPGVNLIDSFVEIDMCQTEPLSPILTSYAR